MSKESWEPIVEQWVSYAKKLAAQKRYAEAVRALERLLEEELPQPEPVQHLLDEFIRLRDANP